MIAKDLKVIWEMSDNGAPAMVANTFETPSAAYLAHRKELRLAEIALKEQRERVAALRRALPDGPTLVGDYAFREGPADIAASQPIRVTPLSALFADGKPGLIVIHFMFADGDEDPCPMCTMWADGYNAIAPHISQRAALVLVAKADITPLRDFARRRGWSNLRLLSSRDTSFNSDFGMENADGHQIPGSSVFSRAADGTIRHFVTNGMRMGDGSNRGLDLLSPVWNILDLLPEGRGEWRPSLNYPD